MKVIRFLFFRNFLDIMKLRNIMELVAFGSLGLRMITTKKGCKGRATEINILSEKQNGTRR